MTPQQKRDAFFKSNPYIHELYCQVRETNERLREGDETQLRALKQYAIEHTRFYQHYTVDDQFPIMSKMDIIRNEEALRSDEPFDKPLHVSSTSGSTGIPFRVTQNYEKRMRTIADLKVYGDYALYPSHEKMLQLRAYNGKELDRRVDERENIWRYDIAKLSEKDLEQLVVFIQEWKPRTIFGYTSTLETISDYILRKGVNLTHQVRSVLVGAEALTDEIAHKITAAFHCPIFDRYSNMEMGIYAQREYGKSHFVVNNASYYFEVVKIDRDEPAAEHEIGRLVFTDLYNHALPMIRYDTGDLGSYAMNGNRKEIEVVFGRKVDSIYDAGNQLISPHGITNAMWGVSGINQWQFIQKGIAEYMVKLSACGKVDEEELLKRLTNVLGKGASISFDYVTEIPVLSSQKRKYILNEMNLRH